MKIALKMWRMFGDDRLGEFSILLCLTEWMQKDLLDARDQTPLAPIKAASIRLIGRSAERQLYI